MTERTSVMNLTMKTYFKHGNHIDTKEPTKAVDLQGKVSKYNIIGFLID